MCIECFLQLIKDKNEERHDGNIKIGKYILFWCVLINFYILI